MARKRHFGELSKQARDRAARAGREYGLSRRQVRERYNRGTYNPFARTARERVPVQFRAQATAAGEVDWHEAALDNVRRTLGDFVKYADDTVVYLTENVSDQMARLIAMASESELLAWAKPQPDSEGNPPPIDSWVGLPSWVTIDDLSVYVNGEWNNPFWYH